MTTGLRSQLQALYEANGELSPALVVDTATPEDHPLHIYFEWDNAIAGAKYRIVQAEDLIRSIKITYTDKRGEKQAVRWWHPVRSDAPSVYDPLDVISENDVSMAVLIRQADREWKQMKRRYGHLNEFWEMVRQEAS